MRHGENDGVHQSIRTKNKEDLIDFEHGIVVGTRQAGLSVLETADLQGLFFYTQPYAGVDSPSSRT